MRRIKSRSFPIELAQKTDIKHHLGLARWRALGGLGHLGASKHMLFNLTSFPSTDVKALCVEHHAEGLCQCWG